MEIIFKSSFPTDTTAPAGELYVRPADAPHATRRDLASFVLTRGIAALLQGAVPITKIVIACDTTRPTLDDMLAAEFAQRLLEEKPLSGSASKFAKYASLVREGLHPGDMPLESSMEGIFLAVRNNYIGDLDQPAIGERFLGDWQRMAHAIFAAIDAGKDPFTTDLFTDSSEFARERAFLKKDHDVYHEDVRRGQQWLVQLPGGPPSSAMLVLDQPRSLLWKYWSRRDTSAPVGGSYLLQVVRWDRGNWVVSTDPVQRLPIKELSEKLQAAEIARDRATATSDPWFDGAPFGYTMVAAPRGASKLSDAEILAIIKRWSKAQPVVNVTKTVLRRVVAVSGGAVLTVVISLMTGMINLHFLSHFAPSSTPPAQQPAQPAPAPNPVNPPIASVDFTARGSALTTAQVHDLTSEGVDIPGYAVIVGVGSTQGDFPALPASCRNARLFYKLLEDHYGFNKSNMKLLVDQPKNPQDSAEPDIPADALPTKSNVQEAINAVGAQTNRYAQGNRTNFIFFYGGHGDPRQAAGDNRIGYLVLSGYSPVTPDDTGFDMGYLTKFISQRVASSHQMLLVDCCYSGFVIRARGLQNPNKSAIYELWKEKARAVITAGTADQQSLEVGTKALFTSNLIRALTPTPVGHLPADQNNDGIVTDQELADYLQKVVSSEAEQYHHHLTPQYLRALPDSDDDVGQFLFIPRNFGN